MLSGKRALLDEVVNLIDVHSSVCWSVGAQLDNCNGVEEAALCGKLAVIGHATTHVVVVTGPCNSLMPTQDNKMLMKIDENTLGENTIVPPRVMCAFHSTSSIFRLHVGWNRTPRNSAQNRIVIIINAHFLCATKDALSPSENERYLIL